MSSEPLFSRDTRWVTRSLALTAALFLMSALGGFLVLPYAQGEVQWGDVWNTICRAAGVRGEQQPRDVVQPGFTVSPAVMTRARATPIPSRSDEAQHSPSNVRFAMGRPASAALHSPNLAGQYASVIYKQLVDFRAGARANAVMTPFAVHLSDQDIIDLAAYYAYLRDYPPITRRRKKQPRAS